MRVAARGTAAGTGKSDTTSVFALEGEAQGLADRLPDLLLDALRVANAVAHGIHGRRRPGTGETFWQFRQFNQASDAATIIDWRRSASSDHLYVREREWEAAHTFWLWPDVSPSMQFRSHLAQTAKRDRAVVLTLAFAELLVRAGERIALMGVTPPLASRKASARIAEALAMHELDPALQASLPPPARLSRFSTALLFSDFLDPPQVIAQRITELAEGGVSGHLVQVLDPAEETLAYEGRMEFRGPEDGERWIADRVETLAAGLPEEARRASRRDRRSGKPGRLVVPGASHRPAGGRAAAGAHHAPAGAGRRLSLEVRGPDGGGRNMTLGPIAFLSPWLLAGALALPVIWWLLRTVPPQPRRLAFPPTRILVGLENREKTPAQTPWWLTLIRMLAAALVILALAEPVLNPNRDKALGGSGPVVLVVDNGWSAAAQWSARTFLIERLIAEAEGQSRPVMIVPTATATRGTNLKIEAPTLARSTATALQPQPFAPDRMAAVEALATALRDKTATVVWLADGIDHDGQTRRFAERLQELAGGGFSDRRHAPRRRGARHLGRRRCRGAPGGAGAARRRRITRRRPACGVGARPAARRDGLHARRRRHARARHLRSAARAQEPGDAR